MADPIQIEGLKEFSRNLKKLDAELPKALRVAFNAAADIVVTDARAGIPSKSGKARRSVKARSTRTAARVVGGGKSAPYYPWLDFGGRVGRKKSIRRPFLSEGRYVYRAFYDNKQKFSDALEAALLDVVKQAGIEVD